MQITIHHDMTFAGSFYGAGAQTVDDTVAQNMINAGFAHLTTPVTPYLNGELANHAAAHAAMGVVDLPGTNRTITASDNAVLADLNALITANHATVAIVITIQADSAVAWTPNAKLAAYQAGAADVSFAAGDGVTLNDPGTQPAAAQYGTARAIRVAANTWSLT